jgi:ADP-heptose:LPS heptosyltransferase
MFQRTSVGMNFRRILFIAEGQMGDLLLLTPAIRATKSTYPSASLSLLVFERRGDPLEKESPLRVFENHRPTSDRSVPILAGNPHLDEIFSVNRAAIRELRGLAKASAERKVVMFLRRKKFDVAICTFPDDRFNVYAFLSGAKVRVGENGQNLERLLTHRVKTRMGDKGVLEYYCDLVKAIGVDVESKNTEYLVPESARSWASDFLTSNGFGSEKKLVAVHPGATGDYKIWPPERFAELIDCLQASLHATVLLLYGKQDAAVAEMIRKTVRTSVADINTGTDVGRLAAILQQCVLCISNDSGPRHLAAAVGTPSLAFLRQHHDRFWKIYPDDDRHATLQGEETCPHCTLNTCLDKVPSGEKYGSYCLRQIEVDIAFRRASQMLGIHKALS